MSGVVANRVFGTLETEPKHKGLTLNSDTPYAPLPMDLRMGPMVIELPPGPLIWLYAAKRGVRPLIGVAIGVCQAIPQWSSSRSR